MSQERLLSAAPDASGSGPVPPAVQAVSKPRELPPPRTVAFDPAGALLDQFAGRPPRHRAPEEG